jgi:energy-coupling factor transporter ATP-binding protein EcfA2
VLNRVSPPGADKLEIGEPVRLPGESREIPTFKHSYGSVPVTYESAGVRRVVALAYLIVWAWQEHRVQSKLAGKPEEKQMVVILDEAEAHLHPKWQRVLLPALLSITKELSPELSMQLIVATHSPLVLASAEPVFNIDSDKLFHLDLTVSGKVGLKEVPFDVRGGVDSWLSSSIFSLAIPGSSDRESAIKNAIALQVSDDATAAQVAKATDDLKEVLAPEDPFWARWIFYADKFGVKL